MRSLERLARSYELVREKSAETEIHQSPALRERVPDRFRDLRRLFEERQRLGQGVPIPRHDAQRAQAACELSLQVPRPQDGQAARAELLGCRVVPESGADGDLVHRRR